MNKNLLLAFILSTVVLGIYWYFFPTTNTQVQVVNQIDTTDSSVSKITNAEQSPLSNNNILVNVDAPVSAEEIEVQTDNYVIAFNSLGASITSLELKEYKYYIKQPKILHLRIWDWITGNKKVAITDIDDKKLVNMIGSAGELSGRAFQFLASPADLNLNYQVGQWDEQTQSIAFSAVSDSGYRITKTYVVDDQNYQISLDIKLEALSEGSSIINPKLLVGAGNEMITKSYRPENKTIMTIIDDDYDKYKVKENMQIQNFEWIAIADTYFVTGLKLANTNWTANIKPLNINIGDKSFTSPLLELDDKEQQLNNQNAWQEKIIVYAGPKDLSLLENFNPNFSETLDLFLNIIARPMLIALRWFHSLAHNWGIAIMMLTLVVRLIMFPLAFSGMKAMKNMAKLNPRLKTLRKKYADDRQKLNTEIMMLYRKNKVNPVAGCLPLIAQIPIFIALYWALLPAVELRHQPFIGWINDLSNYDPYLLLPLLMGITMFIQQKISPPPANLEPIQQKIMQLLPLIMTLFFVNFPAGLVLYWVTSNIITIIQQFFFNKIKVKELIE